MTNEIYKQFFESKIFIIDKVNEIDFDIDDKKISENITLNSIFTYQYGAEWENKKENIF